MSSQAQPQFIDVPALLVEARFRDRPLASRLLRADDERGFYVGGARGADAPVDAAFLSASPPSAANDNYLLVEPSGAGFLVNLSPAMRQRLESTPTHLRIPCGEVVFDISAASPAPAVPRPWLSRGWLDYAPYMMGVVTALLLLLAIIQAIPSDPRALSLDEIGRTFRMVDYRISPPMVPDPPGTKESALAAAGGPGKPVPGRPGELGDKRARPADARRAHKGPPTLQDARAVADYVVQNTVLSVLADHRADTLAEVLSDKPALGADADEVLGHMTGPKFAGAFGEGVGPFGAGTGSYGHGDRLLSGPGGGRLGTIGVCADGERCTGAGHRYGHHAGNLDGRRRTRDVDVIPALAQVRGALDKEIVRRIVRQHLNEVRYCYEQSLVRRPSLSGRVVVNFTIAGTGRVLVSALQSSTLADAAAESCIVAATRRWDYPKPLGGGLVIVSYPFQLAPAGG